MSQAKLKEVFTVKHDDKDVELAILRPSQKVLSEAQKTQNATWAELVRAKTVVRAAMDGVLRDQGLWGDDQEAELMKLQGDLFEVSKRLPAGKNGYDSLATAKEAALGAMKKRQRVFELLSKRNSLDEYTAEAQAEQARTNFLTVACTVYNDDRKPFFRNLEDFQERLDDPATSTAATKLLIFLNDLNLDFEKEYPENQFLVKHGVLNEKLQFVKDGRLYDPDTNLYLNDAGRYVNEAGELVNRAGDRVDEKGEVIVEYVPFDEETASPPV